MLRALQDSVTLAPPIATTGMGLALTLGQVQTLVGIAAGITGTIATIITLIWRHREHKKRMRRGGE